MKKISFGIIITVIIISVTFVQCNREEGVLVPGKLPSISVAKLKSSARIISLSSSTPSTMAQGPDNQCNTSSSGRTSAALRLIVFGDVPSTVEHNFNLTSGADVSIFLRDCCIRDDVVEVYVDDCLIGTVDSRIGGSGVGSHPGETFTVTLSAGDHTIKYINTVSLPGASGWFVEEIEEPLSTVVIGTCDSGVPNFNVSCGVSLVDEIEACKLGARNHGAFVSCVAKKAGDWVESGLITEAQKDALMSCVAKK